jgi:hypothetical protein
VDDPWNGTASLEPAAIERRLARRSAGITLGLALAALFWGWRVSAAVVAGGALALLNYAALRWTVDLILSPERKRGGLAGALGFALRYGLLALSLYVIFVVWRANALAIIAGFSAPVLAIFAEWGIELYLTLRHPDRQKP